MIDTHLHLFDPAAYPFATDAPYIPLPNECTSWDSMRDLLDFHGVTNGILVAATSGYNHDRSPLTGTLRQAAGRLSGVVRLAGNESERELDDLAASGVVGVRLDARVDGLATVLGLVARGIARRWTDRNWFIQVLAAAPDWVQLAAEIPSWDADIVIDHCGLPDTGGDTEQEAFAAVCALARTGRCWAKLSGAFRFSHSDWPHMDVDPFVRVLVNTFGPERCVWGSDWPFVQMRTRLDYGNALGLLARWVPDETDRTVILNKSPLTLLDRRRR